MGTCTTPRASWTTTRVWRDGLQIPAIFRAMSRTQTTEIECPRCKVRTPWVHHASVNVAQDPALRLKLLDQSFYRFTCPGCDLAVPVLSPLLYHDMKRQLMVQLAPEGCGFDGEAVDGPQRAMGPAVWDTVAAITTRVVKTPNALNEKIKVFEAGLDDRAIECLKMRLLVQHAAQFRGELFFNEVRADGALAFVQLVDGKQEGYAIPADFWKSHLEVLGPLGPPNAERWPVVDLGYAKRLYEALAAKQQPTA
jgi:hypothetical protein